MEVVVEEVDWDGVGTWVAITIPFGAVNTSQEGVVHGVEFSIVWNVRFLATQETIERVPERCPIERFV